MAGEAIVAIGRRKTAIARVRLMPGDGTISVNDRVFEDYFQTDSMRARIVKPLLLTDKQKVYSVFCRVNGGGVLAQVGALAHGISRALIKSDVGLRKVLKKELLLRRDPRMKERKKYGQKGARKRFQFSKR